MSFPWCGFQTYRSCCRSCTLLLLLVYKSAVAQHAATSAAASAAGGAERRCAAAMACECLLGKNAVLMKEAVPEFVHKAKIARSTMPAVGMPQLAVTLLLIMLTHDANGFSMSHLGRLTHVYSSSWSRPCGGDRKPAVGARAAQRRGIKTAQYVLESNVRIDSHFIGFQQ